MSVYNDLSVRVHFNVECKELDNYYTSSHPRLMDTDHFTHYDITLPFLEQKAKELKSISLKMSIMIHNFEEFAIDQNDFASNKELMAQDMVHSKKNYEIPDCLSMFYGISNSVISILDSISDIAFIVFLWYYTEPDSLITFGDWQQEQIRVDILLIFTIGNLVSIALVISAIMCQQTGETLWWKRILYFILFFLLSPILPSSEWLLDRIKIVNDDFLIVSPDQDGILLWFQQELIRNKIFLIECTFESCWQIMV
eukprot:400383_1